MALARKNAGDVITAVASNQQFYDILSGVDIDQVLFNHDQAGAYPTLSKGLAIGKNFANAGLIEIDLTNTYAAAVQSFRFYQQTAAGAATLLLTLYASGGVYIGPTPTDPGAGNLAVTGFVLAGRIQGKQGANVASTNDLSLGMDGNSFLVTGTTTINRIASAGWQQGSVVTLLFNGSLTVASNVATGGGFANILLAGNVSFSAVNSSTLTLNYVNGSWFEIGRKA